MVLAETFHITELEWAYSPPMIYPPDNAPVLETTADVALSSDGSLMAIVIGHSLYFAEDGEFYPALWNDEFYEPYALINSNADFDSYDYALSGQLEIAWANPLHRLAPIPESLCPSVEALDMSFGARIAEGLGPNNLRSGPYTNSEYIGNIPEGAVVNLFPNFSPYAAPPIFTCSDHVLWQEVIYEGQVGWTAEAQGDTYYMEN